MVEDNLQIRSSVMLSRGLIVRGYPSILIALFSATILIFLIMFSDRDGYEGDDLNSILPMFHLAEAKRGALLIYRYNWQPLSYELGAAIFRLTKIPDAIFILAPIAGAVSISMLLSLTWRDRRSLAALTASLVAILAIPELLFSALYYNSTIIGLPFAVGALILLSRPSRLPLSLVAGLLTSVAILMRFDFVLACPLFAVVAWHQDRSTGRAIAFLLGVLTGLAVGLFSGLLDPAKLLEIHQISSEEIAAKTNTPGWDTRKKLEVLSVLFSPIGWIIWFIGGPIIVYDQLRRNTTIALLWGAAALPLAVPLLNLLSAKYALPLAIILCIFLTHALLSIEQKLPETLRSWPSRLSAVGTIVFLFISFSISGKPPFVQIETLASRPVGTHDGARSYGGYIWQIAALDRMAPRSEQQLAAEQIRQEYFLPSGPDIVIAGGEDYFERGGIGWRHLQLALERSGIHGTLIAPHQLQFDFHGRRLTMVSNSNPNFVASFDRGVGVKLYDLRELDRGGHGNDH